MLSVSTVGGVQRRDIDEKKNKKLDKFYPEVHVPGQPAQHALVPASSKSDSHQPLTAQQADSLRLLTFAGKNQRVKLEKQFIHTLRNTQDPVEKASVADLLGRAKSVLATPHLKKLLHESEPVPVRTSAAQALANIGSSSHVDGFSAPDLSKVLWDTYLKRKESLQKEIEKPTKDLTYDEKLQREEEHKERYKEINALVNGVSQLDVLHHNRELIGELRSMLQASQEGEASVQELSHQAAIAEAEFHKSLQGKYRRPIQEILKGIPADQLKEMKKNVKVAGPDGKVMNLVEISEQLDQMKLRQEKFDLKLVGSLMDAVSSHNYPEANAAIKVGLDNDHHEIRSRSLEILADRNKLNYSSDVYPNLTASHPKVRQAAMQALLNSPEQAAKQKVMELTNPNEFFKSAGSVNRETFGQFIDFLSEVAERGDQYVDALSRHVMNADYSANSRQIGLELLGMMSREPLAHLLAPETVHQAKEGLKMTVLTTPGKKPADKAAIATTATSLWVLTKEPSAIPAAILLAETKEHKTSGKDQERLLSAVFEVLSKDRKRLDKESRQNDLAGNVLNILEQGKSGLLNEDLAKDLRSRLKPDRLQQQLHAETPEAFADASEGDEPEAGMAEKLKPTLELIRPALTKLAESDKSKATQMLAFRVMGLLQDKDAVPYLIERVNNPLKGQIDWKADVSYKGDPSVDGIRIRYNALQALGDIGDARAVKVFTPLLEDSNLRQMLSKPLAKLAPEANKNASEADLKALRKKLTKLMADPDTGRWMRSVRIEAAKTLFQFNGGVEALKEFVDSTHNPNFKRHVLSALVSNNHGLEPEHPDHHLVKGLLNPELGVERLHARGVTGKGVDIAIVDGGYVDASNKEGFQKRVKLPSSWAGKPKSSHPTMVMSTAAANGKLKGVAPDVRAFSDQWPDFGSQDPMDTYKKIIEGKMRGENNVRIINNSWGLSNQNVVLHKDWRELLKQFKNVVDMAEKAGIQMVFAAGNEGEEPPFPGLGTMTLFGLDVDKLTDEQKRNYNYILDKVITVGATNTQGSAKYADHRLAEFSSVGDSTRNNKLKPTVVAPGADMMVYGWDKVKGNPKELVNGTSFASPYVVGLLALMGQANKDLTPKDMREILKKTAVKLPGVPVSHQGYGEVNPEAAVKMAERYAAGKSSETSAPTEPEGSIQQPSSQAAQDGLDRQDDSGDGDVDMPDVPEQSAGLHATKASHKRSWAAFKSGQKESKKASQRDPLAPKANVGISKPGKLTEGGENLAPRKRRGLSFAGSASVRETAGYTGSAFNRLPDLASGHTTPSKASKLDFSHGPASALRMNPPKEPVLDIIR